MRRVERNLFELFRDQALARPEAVAIDSAAGITTYAGLLDRAETIRRLLEDRGPDAEQAIGVLMQRGPDLIATLLAILGCGAAYVPLDPDDPPVRIGQVIGSVDCRIVLGDRRSIDRLLGGSAGQADLAQGRTFIDIESAASLPSSGPAGPADRNAGSRPIAPGGSRLAYILHTSGSTGTPKGVEIAHRSVVNLLDAVADLIGFGPDDCFLAASTVGFDISVAEIFLPLLTGPSTWATAAFDGGACPGPDRRHPRSAAEWPLPDRRHRRRRRGRCRDRPPAGTRRRGGRAAVPARSGVA